jgi:hypothetical protein
LTHWAPKMAASVSSVVAGLRVRCVVAEGCGVMGFCPGVAAGATRVMLQVEEYCHDS